MAGKPRLYFDSCTFIEIAKGRFGETLPAARKAEVETAQRLLAASRDGYIEIFTSTITIAEAVHTGTNPPPQDVKDYFSRLLLSGRDGVITVAPDPFIVELARDLSWDHGIGKGVADRIHVATALRTQCIELITIDGQLAKRLGKTKIETVRLIPATKTGQLPDQYKTRDLFGDQDDHD